MKKILNLPLDLHCVFIKIINMLLWDLNLFFWHMQYETGWFSQRILNCLRQRVMMRFLSVFPTSGAEALLRAASESFERLKREYRKDCSKIDQGNDHQANAGFKLKLYSTLSSYLCVYLFSHFIGNKNIA